MAFLLNATDLINSIKQAAIDAVEEKQPSAVFFGKVVSAKPLKIQIDQKMILPSEMLVLSRSVVDYTVEMTVDNETKAFTVHNALKIGEMVLLLRQSGGQTYIILDRIGGTL